MSHAQEELPAAATAHVIDFPLPHPREVFVAGAWREPAEPGVIDVIDPTTEEVLIQVARPGTALPFSNEKNLGIHDHRS